MFTCQFGLPLLRKCRIFAFKVGRGIDEFLLFLFCYSCLLFLIVASEATKPTNDGSREAESPHIVLADDSVNDGCVKDSLVGAHEGVVAGVPPPASDSVSREKSDSSSVPRSEVHSEGSALSGKSESSGGDKNKQFGNVPNAVENTNQQNVQAVEHTEPPQPAPIDAERNGGPATAESAATAPDAGDIAKDVAEET